MSNREQLPPELRHRVDNLQSTLRRIVDDLESLEGEAEDMEERIGGPLVPDGPYISGVASEALASLVVGVEALEDDGSGERIGESETEGLPIASELEGAIHAASEQVEAVADMIMDHDGLGEIMQSPDGPDQEQAEVWGCYYGFEMMADRLDRVVERAFAGELDDAGVEGELMEIGGVLHALAATVHRRVEDNPGGGEGVRLFARDVATKVRNLYGEHLNG